MTEEKTVYVPTPQAPCEKCVQDARHMGEDVGIIWCGHVRYGAIYQVVPALWNIIGPFDDQAHFKRFMAVTFAVPKHRQTLKIN